MSENENEFADIATVHLGESKNTSKTKIINPHFKNKEPGKSYTTYVRNTLKWSIGALGVAGLIVGSGGLASGILAASIFAVVYSPWALVPSSNVRSRASLNVIDKFLHDISENKESRVLPVDVSEVVDKEKVDVSDLIKEEFKPYINAAKSFIKILEKKGKGSLSSSEIISLVNYFYDEKLLDQLSDDLKDFVNEEKESFKEISKIMPNTGLHYGYIVTDQAMFVGSLIGLMKEDQEDTIIADLQLSLEEYLQDALKEMKYLKQNDSADKILCISKIDEIIESHPKNSSDSDKKSIELLGVKRVVGETRQRANTI